MRSTAIHPDILYHSFSGLCRYVLRVHKPRAHATVDETIVVYVERQDDGSPAEVTLSLRSFASWACFYEITLGRNIYRVFNETGIADAQAALEKFVCRNA